MAHPKTPIYILLGAASTASLAMALAMAPTNRHNNIAGPPTVNEPDVATRGDLAEPWHKYSFTDKSSYVNKWRDAYPTSTLPERMSTAAGQTCMLCHQPSSKGDQGNCYKEDLLAKLNLNMTIEQAIAAIDGDDSDGDGTSNGDEIRMVRLDLPAEIGYNPGLIGTTGTSPCSKDPNTPISNMPETPEAPCYADCDPSTGIGTLDIFDFLCFQDSFVSGEPYACDCNLSTGPATCDIFDFLCFQDAFVAGCP